MTLAQNVEKLKTSWKGLARQWTRTRDAWPDTVGDEFEREYWAEIQRVMPEYLAKLNEVETVVRQSRARVR